MRVQFESNVDDAVALNLRMMARSKVLRGGRRKDYLPIALIYGVLIGALCFLIMRERDERWGFALGMGLFGAVAILVLTPWRFQQKLRRYYREQFGTDDDYDVEVELLPEGISVKRLGCRFIFDWEIVQELHEAPEFLDLRMQYGGLASVKKSAFESERHMEQFVAEVRRQIEHKSSEPI